MVRYRSVDNVMEEIDLRMRQYYGKGLRHTPTFFDDTFILDTKFVTEFCKQYQKERISSAVPWNVNVRANLVDTELIRIERRRMLSGTNGSRNGE